MTDLLTIKYRTYINGRLVSVRAVEMPRAPTMDDFLQAREIAESMRRPITSKQE